MFSCVFSGTNLLSFFMFNPCESYLVLLATRVWMDPEGVGFWEVAKDGGHRVCTWVGALVCAVTWQSSVL